MKFGKGYIFGRLVRAAVSGRFKVHFSQFGEESVIYRQFPKGYVGTYLDIGAFDPFRFSNTARLWLLGWNGINVDANRVSIEKFKRHRPGDVNILGAVVPSASWREGAVVNFAGSSQKVDPVGRIIASEEKSSSISTREIPAITLDRIVGETSGKIDFMNIDIEGMDEAIICEDSFGRILPTVLAIEQYGEDVSEILARPATRRLLDLRYKMIGRVHLTSIFRRDVG